MTVHVRVQTDTQTEDIFSDQAWMIDVYIMYLGLPCRAACAVRSRAMGVRRGKEPSPSGFDKYFIKNLCYDHSSSPT